MRSKKMRRLVVDASVAAAAGGESADAHDSVNCTLFLETFQNLPSLHAVMTFELSEEWENNQSNYAATWLSHMIATKRFHYVKLTQNRVLYDKIEETAIQEKDIKIMLKDYHLLGAALVTDKTVISLDETVRMLFAEASQEVGEIRGIIWVNPNRITEEQPIEWLQNGAPAETHRQLSAYST